MVDIDEEDSLDQFLLGKEKKHPDVSVSAEDLDKLKKSRVPINTKKE